MGRKTELRKRIDEFCLDTWPDEEIVLFGGADGDPYDKGFLGVGFQQYKGPVAIYDREKCVDSLAEEFEKASFADADSDPYSDAVEWFDYNTAGSWVGEKTPIIIARFDNT